MDLILQYTQIFLLLIFFVWAGNYYFIGSFHFEFLFGKKDYLEGKYAKPALGRV